VCGELIVSNQNDYRNKFDVISVFLMLITTKNPKALSLSTLYSLVNWVASSITVLIYD